MDAARNIAAAGADAERDGYTIPEFCRRFGISTPTYYKMRAAGEGPREIRMVGSVVRISAEAIAAWRLSREQPTGANADAIEAQRARLKQRSERANAGGVR